MISLLFDAFFAIPVSSTSTSRPPCGTCSRARGIPLSSGAPGPPPLRSEEYSWGLPDLADLRPQDLGRVRTANTLYEVIREAVLELIARRILWSLENPRDSLFWYILRVLTEHPETDTTTFQHCAYGGGRPKWTKWLFFPKDVFSELSATCPGVSSAHAHAPWGQSHDGSFNTALEAAYPPGLCAKITDILKKHLKFTASAPLPVIRARGEPAPRDHRPEREAAGRQPRGGRSRALLPEFLHTIKIHLTTTAADPRCKPGHIWKASMIGGTSVPAGARTIRTYHGQSSSSSSAPSSSSSSCSSSRSLPTRGCIHSVRTLGPNDVYIGREHRGKCGHFLAGSEWANPFKVKDAPSVCECISRFDTHLRASP